MWRYFFSSSCISLAFRQGETCRFRGNPPPPETLIFQEVKKYETRLLFFSYNFYKYFKMKEVSEMSFLLSEPSLVFFLDLKAKHIRTVLLTSNMFPVATL